MTKLGIF